MTDNLPPLPAPKYGPDTTVDEDDDPEGAWSHAQMQAYARAALAQAQILPDGLQRLHDLLYTAQTSTGEKQSAAIGEARIVLYRLREGAPPQPQPVQPSERCPNCDDTGDVHSIDGQWRGVCHCPAGKAVNAHPVAQAKPEQAAQPLNDEETALDLLAEVFDAYENGTPCYEEPDEHGSFVGNAFVLSNETFHACADLLNRRRPVPAAPQPKD